MRTLLAVLLALPIILADSTVRADGLIYKLPEDGAWVKYDMNATRRHGGNPQRVETGSIRMASVGRAIENGKKCRWIELQIWMPGEQVDVIKLLIPESQLGKAGRPAESIIRGQTKRGDRDARPLRNVNRCPIPEYFPGPLSNAGQLKAVEMDTKLGKLQCKGVTGQHVFQEGPLTYRVHHSIRLHPKAPFGVISSRMEIQVKQDENEEFLPSDVIELTLAETGKDAKSLLPDVK